MISAKEVQSDWKIVKLKDYVFFQEGPGLRNWQFCNQGIKIINVKNIVNGKLILENSKNFCSKEEVDKKYRHFLLEEKDIVMASSGVTWGKTATVENTNLPLMLNTSVIRFRTLDERCLRRHFLKIILDSTYFKRQIKRLITGGCQPNFGPSHLKKVNIILPPPAIQDNIISIIEKAERLKEWRNQSDKLTQDYLSSVFAKMFGSLKSNKEPKMIRLKQIATIDRQNVYPSEFSEDSVYVGLEHIEKDTGEILRHNVVGNQDIKSSKFSFSKKHVLYGKLRPYLNKVGLPQFSGICSTDILPIAPIDGLANRYFIAYLLRQNAFVKYATSKAVGANLPRINPQAVGEYQFPYPPIELQDKFELLVKEIEKIKDIQQKLTIELNSLLSILTQKALNGDYKC